MNTASRMESTSRPGCIQVSEATYILLKDTEAFTATGGIEIKGKGLMPTFYLEMDAEATAEGSKRLPSAKSRPLMALRTTSPEISKIDVAANSGLNAMSAMDLNVHLTRSDFSGELSPREPSLANEHIDDHGRGLRMKKSSSIADLPSLTSSRSSSRIPRHTSSQQAIKALPSSTSQLIKRNVPGGSPSTTPLDRSSNLIIAEALAAAFAAGGEDLVVDKKRSLFRTKRSTSILPPGDVPLSSEVNIDVPRNGQNLRPVCSPLTQHGGFSLDPGLVAMCQSTLSFQKFLKAWQPEPPLLGHSSSLKAPPGLQSELGLAAGGQGQRRRSILVDQMNDNFVDRRVAEFL